MRKIQGYLFLFACFFCCIPIRGQHTNKVTATLDDTNKVLQIKQEFTYVNESKQSLAVLYFNDWNHSYSNKNTALTKRFGNEFNRSLHLAKFKERGRTIINTVVDDQYQGLTWERTGKRDIIRIILNDNLEPGASVKVYLTYAVKLPSAKFTGYGYTNRGEYFLENWYLSPTVFSNGEWRPYSNKNLDDLYTDVANTTVNLIYPSGLHFASNYNFGKQLSISWGTTNHCRGKTAKKLRNTLDAAAGVCCTSNIGNDPNLQFNRRVKV